MRKLLIAGCIFAFVPIFGFILTIVLDKTVEKKDWVLSEQYPSNAGRCSVDVYTVPSEKNKELTEVKVLAADHIGFKSAVIKNETYDCPEFSFKDVFWEGYSLFTITYKGSSEEIKIIWSEAFSQPQ